MDSAAIRQALRDTVGLTLDHPTADEAQEVLRAAAAAYADYLDGPTDTRERVAKAIGMADVPNPGDSQQDHYLRLADATLRVLLLSGPTDEDVEVLAKASRHTFQDRNGEWQNVVTQADLDEARRLLEAVFRARKEADRG